MILPRPIPCIKEKAPCLESAENNHLTPTGASAILVATMSETEKQFPLTRAGSKPSARRNSKFLSIIGIWLMFMGAARATILSWSGGGATGNWSDSANWGYVGTPASGDTLIFSAGQPRLTNTNNISNLVLNQIRFVGPAGSYGIWGNSFTITNSIEATNTAGANTINNYITIQTVDVRINVGAAGLSLLGNLGGTVGVIKNGSGTLNYGGPSNNTYPGTTLVNAGVLVLNVNGSSAFGGPLVIGDGVNAATVRNAQSFEIPGVPITVNANSTLDLNGYSDTIGTVLTLDSGVVQTGAGTLTMSANSTITADSTCFITGNLYVSSGTCTFQGGGYLYVNAAVSGSAAIVKNGALGIYLNGANSFTGTLTINDGGWISISTPTALGTTNGGTIVNDPAFLAITGGISVTNEPLTLNSLVAGVYGALYVYGGNNSWLDNITLGAGATINVYSGCGLDLIGALSGSGGITKAGTGRLRFSGSTGNNYAGDTIVTAGLLELNKPAGLNAIPGALNISGGTVRLWADHQLADTSDVHLGSSGTLDMNGWSDYVDALSGSGSVTLGTIDNYLVFGAGGGSSTFNGIISGAGRIYKFGSGQVTLNGNNTLTGTTYAYAGVLLVNGSQPQSPAYVTPSGTLGGSGTVGNLYCEGSLLPGTSPGILTCSNATFTSAGRYYVDLADPTPGAGYDQLIVRGTNQLGSATLHLVPSFSSPVAVGDQFVIINNDGAEAVTGTFNGLADGATIDTGFYKFRINYGNDVILTLTDVPGAQGGDAVTSGNGNHSIDPNECSQLALVISNKSATPMTGVTATLSSADPNVMVTQPFSSYPDAAAFGGSTNTTPFQLSTLPSFPCSHDLNLNLALATASHGSFVVPVVLHSGQLSPTPVRYDNNIVTNVPDIGTIESTNLVAAWSGGPISKVVVSLWLVAPFSSDMTLTLLAPDGTAVLLSSGNGAGANFGTGTADTNRTTFDDDALTSITAGASPFVGSYRPQASLAALSGTTPTGNWRLRIQDSYGSSTPDTLRAWSLFLYDITCAPGGGACALCSGGVLLTNILDTTSSTMPQRLYRDGASSTCAAPKPVCPGTFNGNFYYHAYPFYNGPSNACVTVALTVFGGQLMTVAYLGAFSPTNACLNYLADSGSSVTGSGAITNSFNVPPESIFTIVVNSVSTPGAYTLAVSGGDCRPLLAIQPAASPNVNINWPSVAGGYQLESTLALPLDTWNPVTNEPIVVNSRFNVTNSAVSPANRFYRLHMPVLNGSH